MSIKSLYKFQTIFDESNLDKEITFNFSINTKLLTFNFISNITI
jgi:hypothetical protein